MGWVHSKPKKNVENICDFPDEILLKIFGYLDFHEQFRVRRVNERFRRVSEMAVSEIKALQFKEDPDRMWGTTPEARNAMMSPVSLRKMMELCSERLANVDFTGHRMVDLVRIFSEFTCPNLSEIALTRMRIDDDTFGRLIKNSRSLKKFEWRSAEYAPIFPNNVVREKLETLRITVNQKTVNSMIGRFPNLKQVFLCVPAEISLNGMNDFFSSCPSIETLELDTTNELQIPLGNSFWRLPLRNLAWVDSTWNDSSENDGDTLMHQVATSFPRLETLKFTRRLSSNGIGELAILHELVEIELRFGIQMFYDEVDDGLCQLVVGCPKLETLRLGAEIEPSTLVKLVNECKKLRVLYVFDVNVDTEEAAVEVVSQFNGFGENITIMMHNLWGWMSQDVKEVLDELKENTTRQIKFEH